MASANGGGSWSLPAEGILASVSTAPQLHQQSGGTGAGGSSLSDWRPVVSSNEVSTVATATTIDARMNSAKPLSDAAGRSAAAFADVSCRQFGYDRAVAVTNCRTLLDIERSSSSSTGQKKGNVSASAFALLCPELGAGDKLSKTCPSWLEVPKQSDAATFNQFDWLWGLAQPQAMYNALSFGRKQGWPGPMPYLSSCSGRESNLAQCFQSQVLKWMHLGSPTPIATRQPCLNKILVGCANHGHGGGSGSGGGESGTWVLGDQDVGHEAGGAWGNVQSPKIFTSYGLRNCSTGREIRGDDQAALAQVAHSTEGELCWGQLLTREEGTREEAPH